MTPIATEHQYHTVVCPKCSKRTVAAPPPEVPQGAFGARAEATALCVLAAGRLSVLETKRVFENLLHLPVVCGNWIPV